MDNDLLTIISNKLLMSIQFEDLVDSVETPKLKRILSNIAKQEDIILGKVMQYAEKKEVKIPKSEREFTNLANITLIDESNSDDEIVDKLIEQKNKLIEFYKEFLYITDQHTLTRLIEKAIDLEYKHIAALMDFI